MTIGLHCRVDPISKSNPDPALLHLLFSFRLSVMLLLFLLCFYMLPCVSLVVCWHSLRLLFIPPRSNIAKKPAHEMHMPLHLLSLRFVAAKCCCCCCWCYSSVQYGFDPLNSAPMLTCIGCEYAIETVEPLVCKGARSFVIEWGYESFKYSRWVWLLLNYSSLNVICLVLCFSLCYLILCNISCYAIFLVTIVFKFEMRSMRSFDPLRYEPVKRTRYGDFWAGRSCVNLWLILTTSCLDS